MTYESDEGDDARFDPPLPPDDRLWRHPSELAGGAPPNETTAEDPHRVVSGPHGLARTGGVALAGGAAGAVAVLALLVVLGVFEDNTSSGTVIERVQEIPATDDQRAMAENALPSIVRVEVIKGTGVVPGTAVSYRDDGNLLTTADLVSDADSVEVVTNDGTRLAAVVVGADMLTDIAVIKVEQPVATVVLGSAADLERGEQVLAISSPPSEASAATVTQGIVWATHVSITTYDGSKLLDLIQTSATVGALSPGSAILDQYGAMVGLMTGRRSSTDGGADPEGTGPYLIPIRYARHIGDEIVELGRANHPWLGIEGRDLMEDEAPAPGGAMVTAVALDSPAERAGLEQGDVIVSLDGQTVEDMADFAVAIRDYDPGELISLDYRRNGEMQSSQPELVAWNTREK